MLAVLLSMATVAADEVPGWMATRTLPAPEAHQAAAADDRFVYAITNTQVAKYDRGTGRRVAVSSGAAKHLNSGFVWQGKLYCAHSNYPQTPEQSELLVLDLESMQLTTFRDFGNYGGSLTWAVHHDGQWWCFFAKYGADNAGSFLVRFSPEWTEERRWTLPPEILPKLGRNSLSGGLWDGDTLLTTGHDDPVVFRLRVPANGTVLELVETLPVPFTGQGIAVDPVTGGLVGIHRARKQLVFAERPETTPHRLRVLSYNIHHGEGVDGRLDLERIARVMAAVKPDLIALQEVDQNATRSQSVDQPAELARLMQMHVAFGDNLPLQGGKYGNAVLSRFPIVRQQNHRLPNLDNGEQRGVLEVEIAVPGREPPLRLFATHLDHRPNHAERLASARAINELATAVSHRMDLLAGDLNDVPGSPVLEAFETIWSRTNWEPLPTIPVAEPRRQIDYVLFRPQDRWRVVETFVLDEAVASDHRPILAVLDWLPPPRTRRTP
jgi:endonuclease/exonuclease/phosphatase family metal-dependent hydrolase